MCLKIFPAFIYHYSVPKPFSHSKVILTAAASLSVPKSVLGCSRETGATGSLGVCVCVCVYIYGGGEERDIIRNWFMWSWRLTSPKICRVSIMLRAWGELMGYLQSKGWQAWDIGKTKVSAQVPQAERILSYSREEQCFCLLRPIADWVRPTHVREGNLLYPVCWCIIQVNVIPKHPHSNAQSNIWLNIWAHVAQSRRHMKFTTTHTLAVFVGSRN